MIFKRTSALLLLLALWGCSPSENAVIDGCESTADLEVICGLQAPEDIAVLPGDQLLLLSQFGGMAGERGGSLAILDTASREHRIVFPGAVEYSADPLWGDLDCREAPDQGLFSPHGTHLHQLLDGRWRFAVVNHGGREAIELFEYIPDAVVDLVWRGCAMPAPDSAMNDVVGLASGEMVYTNMYAASDSLALPKTMLTFDTGEVWLWRPGSELEALPGTEGAMPNGVEIDEQGVYVFINHYMNNRVLKYDLANREVVGSAVVPSPDNSAWAPDGRLWVASHVAGIADTLACFSDQVKTCGSAFQIVALDPETMANEIVFEHEGLPMGSATVAVQAGDTVYMGSYAGDRLLLVPANRL